MVELENNEENKANLEERFFRITGTYNERLFEDYIAQESADMRPEMPSAATTVKKKESLKDGIASLLKNVKTKLSGNAENAEAQNEDNSKVETTEQSVGESAINVQTANDEHGEGDEQ